MSAADQPISHEIGYGMKAFRGGGARRPLHRAERALLWILGVHLCFLPWALGTMHPWSQVVSLVLAAAGFVVALRPRVYEEEEGERVEEIRLVPWVKLRKFPIFWIGLALLVLVAIQGFNPSWRYLHTPKVWWLVRNKDVPWLPTGVKAPFGRFNAWRDFIIGVSAWMATCAVWVGLIRKRSLRILLTVLVVNGALLCGLEFYQVATHDHRVPWPLTALTDEQLNASFIYKNHAGAYLALLAFAALALATWCFDRAVRAMSKSSPAGVLGLAALLLGGGVLFTLSRGASITLALMLLAFGAWFLVRRKVLPQERGANPMVTAAVTAVVALFVLNTVRYLDFSEIFSRFDTMAEEGVNAPSVRSRILAHEAAGDMLRANWLRGVGAGGFRYLFPEYVKRYPEIYEGGDLYWEHAHGDWWEVPIELGLAGDLLLLGGVAWWVAWFVRKRLLWQALAVPLVLGCVQTVVHAEFDFPFQCPAILITWCVLVAVAAKAAE